MTTQECNARDQRMIDNILAVLRVHEQLGRHANALHVAIDDGTIVLRGELPTPSLKSELIPAVRRAGVLGQVQDCVRVDGHGEQPSQLSVA